MQHVRLQAVQRPKLKAAKWRSCLPLMYLLDSFHICNKIHWSFHHKSIQFSFIIKFAIHVACIQLLKIITSVARRQVTGAKLPPQSAIKRRPAYLVWRLFNSECQAWCMLYHIDWEMSSGISSEHILNPSHYIDFHKQHSDWFCWSSGSTESV